MTRASKTPIKCAHSDVVHLNMKPKHQWLCVGCGELRPGGAGLKPDEKAALVEYVKALRELAKTSKRKINA